jgi:hypothetical protein
MTLGQVAYEAYCRKSDWKSLISGQRLPLWKDLSDNIKEAWEAAALVVKTYNPAVQDAAAKAFEEHICGGQTQDNR